VSWLCFSLFDCVLLDLEYFLMESTVHVLLVATQIWFLFGLTIGGSSRSTAPSVATGARSSFIFGSILCTDRRSIFFCAAPLQSSLLSVFPSLSQLVFRGHPRSKVLGESVLSTPFGFSLPPELGCCFECAEQGLFLSASLILGFGFFFCRCSVKVQLRVARARPVDDSHRPCVSAPTDSHTRILQDRVLVWFVGQFRFWAPFPCGLFDLFLAAEQGRPPVSSSLGLQFQRAASVSHYWPHPVFPLHNLSSVDSLLLVLRVGICSSVFSLVYGVRSVLRYVFKLPFFF
jgi:hypothetical protein